MLTNSQVISNIHNAKRGLYWFHKVDTKLVFTPRLTHKENINPRVVKTQEAPPAFAETSFL